MLRARATVPPPHGREHENPPHSPTTQSTGHGAALQLPVWLMAAGGGHAVPLNRGGATTLRARECDPPPHVREHAVQFDQGVTAQ
jgi:hypothetical protein